ncbi:hypothetical protein ACE193_17940 [Bernardetia sp. OM2101]|uniref:hypothetical protein n=1 Tax=Bernardetia sp. OM2101 TaxID=3344876 RepID=UPI0035CF3381
MYSIKLKDKLIGTTKLEYADVSMGMVYGEINFENILSPYSFFKSFCQDFNIELATDYPDDKLLTTRIIPQLKIYNSKQEVIKGQGYITGMDNSDFQIVFRVLDSDLMEKEFCHHF